MLIEGSEGKVQGKDGELAAQWLVQRRACLAQRRRFPQWRHSVGDGRAVTGLGG